MVELPPEAEAANLAELNRMIEADEVSEAAFKQASAPTPNAEDRELGTELEEESEDSGKPTAPETPEKPPEEPAKEPEKKEPEDDRDDATKKEEEPLSRFEKKKRSEERRLYKTWNEANADKASIAKDREEIAKAKAEIEAAQKQGANSASAEVRDKILLETAMEKWHEEGKTELIELGKAEMKRLNAAILAQVRDVPARSPENGQFIPSNAADPAREQALAKNWETTKTEFPDLLIAGSPLNNAFREFQKENSDVFEHPKAPRLVAEYLDLKARAARLPELTKTIESLQNELQNLRTLTSPIPGGGSTGKAPRRFSELSLAEQEAQLERELAEN